MVHRRPARLGDQVVVDEGHQHQHPDQPVDDRGHAGQQPHDRLQDVPHPLRGELDDEDRDEEGAGEGDEDGSPGDQDGAPDQRPGVQRVDRLGPRGLPRLEDRLQLIVDAAACREPREAVVLEGRPAADEDEHDHRHQQADHGHDQRAERELGAPVGPPRNLFRGEEFLLEVEGVSLGGQLASATSSSCRFD